GDSTGGDSTGGDSTGGDSTGGGSSGGGSTGGDSTGGDSTGGDSTGGGSTDNPDEPEEPDYATINDTMLDNLKFVSDDIDTNQYQFPTGDCRNLVLLIKYCIDDARTYGDKVIIDDDFIRTKYHDEIYGTETQEGATDIYDRIMANPESKAAFQEGLSWLNGTTINWLANEFGIVQ
ncbi:MAG: hypothetical protein J6D04_04365, partial [Clostridia bacterium]|nr:hypothetical protein [Clostridia bacterium]